MTPQTVPGDDDGRLIQGLVDEEPHGALGQVVHDRGKSQFLPELWEFKSSLHSRIANHCHFLYE